MKNKDNPSNGFYKILGIMSLNGFAIYRFLSLTASFVVGWIIYIVGVMVFPYDGVIAIVFQIVIGAILTGIVVLLSWFIGFLARKYVPAKYVPGYCFHLAIIDLCLFLLIFGYSIGLRGYYIDPETGTSFQSGNATVCIDSYVLIVFFMANWPRNKERISLV